jgi:formyl-CoA transferase
MEPLSHIRVLDLTRARSGPTCVRQLSEMGAQVIKVELPGEDDDSVGGRSGSDFQNLHPNKRSITVDMKTPEGKEIIFRLARNADVLVENFRPRVKHRLGIDYETLKKINPRLVYTSISGFGQEGPYKDHAGLDQIAQGLSGFMTVNGFPENGPLRAGLPIADLTAGIMAAYGTVVALLERERSGEGQWVHTSLLQGMMRLMDLQAARWLQGGEIPPQAGNYHPVGTPTGVYKCKDGSIIIQAAGGRLYTRLLEVIEAPELAEDPRFKTADARWENRDKMNAIVEEWTRQRSKYEVMQLLGDAGVPCGACQDTGEVLADPHLKAREMIVDIDYPTRGTYQTVGCPVKLSDSPAEITRPPLLGEHTAELLHDLCGVDPDAVKRLKEEGVV